METSGAKYPFEFCALRYLLQWQRKEKKLHKLIKSDGLEPAALRQALRYFQVARNFKGLKLDARASLIVESLLSIRANSHLNPEEKVVELATEFKNSEFQNNISASSKLLWLSHRRPYIIYDSRAFTALKENYRHEGKAKDYISFCKSWRTAYKDCEPDISLAVNRLPNVRSFLPGSTPPDKSLLSLVNKQWFKERVFDVYLWELGGDG